MSTSTFYAAIRINLLQFLYSFSSNASIKKWESPFAPKRGAGFAIGGGLLLLIFLVKELE